MNSERNSSLDDRDVHMSIGESGSLDRIYGNVNSPHFSGSNFIRPKAIKPVSTSGFSFLSGWGVNGMNRFSMNPTFYWMKYQMMKPCNTIEDIVDNKAINERQQHHGLWKQNSFKLN